MKKNDGNGDSLEEIERKRKLQEEAEDLLQRVTTSNLSTLLEKVGWILNHYPQTRDSDVRLQQKYWESFEPDYLEGQSISFEDLFKATRLTSITRARAKIQNEYNLFLASNEVRKRRGKLEEEQREWAVESKPDFPVYTVFIDESGKTAKYLIVGSLWILDHMSNLSIFADVNRLREETQIDYEFHFSDLNQYRREYYYGILDIITRYSSTISFKAISVERAGNKDINNTLTLMMSYLLVDGIKHENETKRAPLPRILQVVKDKEEAGSDKIMLREIRNRIEQIGSSKYKDALFLDTFNPVDSKGHTFLQITDLFTSSINRMLNVDSDGGHIKDKYAKRFLATLGINIEEGVITSIGDIAKIMEV